MPMGRSPHMAQTSNSVIQLYLTPKTKCPRYWYYNDPADGNARMACSLPIYRHFVEIYGGEDCILGLNIWGINCNWEGLFVAWQLLYNNRYIQLTEALRRMKPEDCASRAPLVPKFGNSHEYQDWDGWRTFQERRMEIGDKQNRTDKCTDECFLGSCNAIRRLGKWWPPTSRRTSWIVNNYMI